MKMEEKLESTKRTAAFRELMGSVEAWWAEQMNDCGCRPLQRLQAIIYAANNVTAFNLLSGEDFDEVLRLLQMSDAEELGKEFPDETLFKFRNANKHPLKGLMKFGDDEVEVDFKGLPDDHMIPEVIEAQRRFVVYRIVSRARKKVVMLVGRDLTRAELEEMSPETCQKLMQLNNILVDGMSAEELEQSGWGALKNRIDEKMAN